VEGEADDGEEEGRLDRVVVLKTPILWSTVPETTEIA
jgi:hypothetical protein